MYSIPSTITPTNCTQSVPMFTSNVIPCGHAGPSGARFDWAPGKARVDLPPSWHGPQPPAKLVAYVSKTDGRLLMFGTERVSPPVPHAGTGDEDVPAPASAWGSASASASASTSALPTADNLSAAYLHFLRSQSVAVDLATATIPPGFPMGRARYRDLAGVERQPTGRISATETVWTAMQFMDRIRALPVPFEGNLPSAAYFKLSGYTSLGENPAFTVPAELLRQQRDADEGMLSRFLAWLDQSPTFRKVIRHAALTGLKQCTVTVVGSALDAADGTAIYTAVGANKALNEIIVPLRDVRPVGNQYYLFNGNVLMPMSATCVALRSFLVALLPGSVFDYRPWLIEGSQRLDPRRIVAEGVAERGLVDYMAQRVLKELGFGGYRWLSPLPFRDGAAIMPPGADIPIALPSTEIQEALDAIGGAKVVEAYVEWQDQYLEQLYPLAAGQQAQDGNSRRLY